MRRVENKMCIRDRISMFTIGIPSFVVSLEPNKSLIKGKFLTNVFKLSLIHIWKEKGGEVRTRFSGLPENRKKNRFPKPYTALTEQICLSLIHI